MVTLKITPRSGIGPQLLTDLVLTVHSMSVDTQCERLQDSSWNKMLRDEIKKIADADSSQLTKNMCTLSQRSRSVLSTYCCELSYISVGGKHCITLHVPKQKGRNIPNHHMSCVWIRPHQYFGLNSVLGIVTVIVMWRIVREINYTIHDRYIVQLFSPQSVFVFYLNLISAKECGSLSEFRWKHTRAS